MPDQHCLSYLFIKFLSNSFLSMGSLSCMHLRVHIYIYIYIGVSTLTNRLPSCPARKGNRMGPLVLPVLLSALSVCDLCSQLCIYLVYVCSVCVPTGNTSSSLLLVGLGDMEKQQQPHFPQAVRSSVIYFPLKYPSINICHVQLM